MLKMFKNITFIILLASLLSCNDMLDPELDGTLTEEEVWSNNNLAFGVLNNAYNFLPDGYNRLSGGMLAAATDDAICPDPSNAVNGFKNGAWGPFNLIDEAWTRNYTGIRKANLFLQKIDSVPLPRQSNALGTDESILNTRERMKGEAHFLRAYFYFELVKRFGGVPIYDKPLSPEEANTIERSSADATFQYIIEQCDIAAEALPTNYKPGGSPVVGFNEAKDEGRATVGAALALKSRALLYWASPLFNPNNEVSRWEMAAEAAKAILDPDGEEPIVAQYNLQRLTSSLTLSTLFSTNALLDQYHDEIIFSTKYNDNTTVERLNAPISFGGQGLTNPTQNLADAFPMSNGKPITDPTSGFDPQNPYQNRDPRFGMTLLANGADFTVNDRDGVMETYKGGADGSDAYPTASQTGYYLQKFIMPDAAWEERSVNITRTWALIRLAEIYLNYAEARNEAFGPDQEVYFHLRMLRFRAGIRRAFVPTGMSQDEMRKFIQNERRIELAFEEHRFFDVRRWRLFDDAAERDKLLNIKGVSITKDNTDMFLYDQDLLLEQRPFTDNMYLFPLPENELVKNNNLKQNPGW
jgi:hypothetical protein